VLFIAANHSLIPSIYLINVATIVDIAIVINNNLSLGLDQKDSKEETYTVKLTKTQQCIDRKSNTNSDQ
jgi:hypothetical protein